MRQNPELLFEELAVRLNREHQLDRMPFDLPVKAVNRMAHLERTQRD